VVLKAAEIVAIEPSCQPGFLVLRHQGGAVRLFNDFTAFHEFLTWLEKANSGVAPRRC
jgi:hypothetical protein